MFPRLKTVVSGDPGRAGGLTPTEHAQDCILLGFYFVHASIDEARDSRLEISRGGARRLETAGGWCRVTRTDRPETP